MDLNGLAAILLLFLNSAYAPETTPIAPEAPPRAEQPALGDYERVFSFYLWLGAGFGLATGTPISASELEVNPGLTPSPLHVMPEVGLTWFSTIETTFFWKTYNISSDIGTFGGRVKYWYDGDGVVNSSVGLGGGRGYIFHVVDLRPAVDAKDKTREGEYHVAITHESGYSITKNIAILFRVDIAAYFPTPSVHADLNFGASFGF